MFSPMREIGTKGSIRNGNLLSDNSTRRIVIHRLKNCNLVKRSVIYKLNKFKEKLNVVNVFFSIKLQI